MAGKSVRYSPLLPFALRVDRERSPRYHRGHLDDSLQNELFRTGEGNVNETYLHKVERGDPFRFAFDATDNAVHAVQVIDCRGTVLLTIAQTATADIAGNVASDGSQYHSYKYAMPNLNAIAADGVYYLLVTVTWASGLPYRAVSEPFELKAVHPDTICIEYRHSENKLGMWFENLPMRPILRVPGFIGDLDTLTSSTVYQDQGYNTVPLDDNGFRNHTLFIQPVADYMRDKLNDIFTCNYVLLDGKQYTKASESAKLEKEGAVTASLWGSTLTIQEADGAEGFEYDDPAIPLFTAAYPYALQSITLKSGSLVVQVMPPTVAGYEVFDSTQEAAMITALNAALASQEMFGVIAKVAGVLTYTNGPGENYRSADATLYTTFVGSNIASNGPIGSGPGAIYPGLVINLRRARGLLSWGDGTPLETVPFTTGNLAMQHTYVVPAGNYPLRIWGFTEALSIVSNMRQGLTGTLPVGLRGLSLDFGTFPSNTFLFSMLAPVASTLNLLSITRNGLTAANGFNNIYMPNLEFIDFSQNAFSGQVMGAFVYDVFFNASNKGTYNPVFAGGKFSIGAQTTGAVLNGQGVSYKSVLTSAPFYWTVNS